MNAEQRKEEIDNYFNFLEIFDDDATKILYKKDGDNIIERINPDFQNTVTH